MSIVALKSMSDCTDLFYRRLNVYQWRYAEVVLCERPCHCECVAPDNLFHRAVPYISVDSILSRREGPAQGGASWWREGGPFWSSQGGEMVRAIGPEIEGGG